MHHIQLNIADDIFEKFIGLIDILPKDSIKIEEIDSIPFYPAISSEEAKEKIENSIANISKQQGRDSNIVFKELLS